MAPTIVYLAQGRLRVKRDGRPAEDWTSPFSEQQILLQRLQHVENTLEKIATRIRSGQTDYENGSDTGGEGSKYQNVDTLLKYVDGAGAEGGVKLVIMNFND